MPKLKTNKAAKKRYSLTATGKVKRTTANRRHLKDKNYQADAQVLMQIKHVKIQLKNYYHMVTKIGRE